MQFNIVLPDKVSVQLAEVCKSHGLSMSGLVLGLVYMGCGSFDLTKSIDLGSYVDDWLDPCILGVSDAR